MRNKLELEVISFLLSQYEGSGEVAERATELRKKVEEDAEEFARNYLGYKSALDESPVNPETQDLLTPAQREFAEDLRQMAADKSAAPAETGGEPGDHLADAPLANPLRAHAGKKRKGHA